MHKVIKKKKVLISNQLLQVFLSSVLITMGGALDWT